MTRLHLVPHTHWDREWYKGAESFRVSLLALVDEVLAGTEPFLLDGQGAVLDDYLAWAPHRRPDVARALQSGRVEAGPWYVLADNLIPSGEALVRNLLAGRATLEALGADPPPVLYCPDTFGHPSVGPTLAAGFGFALAMVWRGYGGRGWPAGDTARWRGPDGSETLLYHLPPSGYEFGSNLPVSADAAKDRWMVLHAVLGERSASGELLVLNGADHHALQADASAAWHALKRAAAPVPVVMHGLRGFADALAGWARCRSMAAVQGELRSSPSYVWTLPGTLATRASQKRANAHLERRLVRQVEPWLALARWRGLADRSDALAASWRLALQNHPHDTLCGCSVDDVALAMDDRLRSASAVSEELLHTALVQLAFTDRTTEATGVPTLVMANAAARPRRGVMEATLDVPLSRVAVGPGSAAHEPAVRTAEPMVIGVPPVPMQVVSRTRMFVRDEHPRRYPRNYLVERQQVLVFADELPGYGVRAVPVRAGSNKKKPPHPVWVVKGELNNGRVAVWYDEENGLCCAYKGRTLYDLLRVESDGERGDCYTHSAIPDTRRIGRVRRHAIVSRGPLRAELRLVLRVPVAGRTVTNAAGVATTHRDRAVDVVVRVQLDAEAPWFRLVVESRNTLADYRLRLVVRTGCASPRHLADAAFGPVWRSSLANEQQPGDVESMPGTAPLHRYVSCFDSSRGYGMSVYSDGLAEYEATSHGDVAITLLRAVGELSRNDLPERPGHAGWPAETPLAQCPGPLTATFAVYPHGLDTPAMRDNIEHVADDVLLPLCGHTVWAPVDVRAASFSGVSLEGAGLRCLCVKPAGRGGGIVVRFANVTGQWAPAICTVPDATRAWLARLDETPTGALVVQENRVRLQVAPYAVMTIVFERGAAI